MCGHARSLVQLFVTPWTVPCQAPLSMRFHRQKYWSGLPFPSPGDLPDSGIKPCVTGRFFTRLPNSGKPSTRADPVPDCPCFSTLPSPREPYGVFFHSTSQSSHSQCFFIIVFPCLVSASQSVQSLSHVQLFVTT